MEQREDLLKTTALHQSELGNTKIEKEGLEKAKDVKEHIDRLKKFAVAISNNDREKLRTNADTPIF